MKRLYQAWKNMKQRCYNPKASRFSAYGGRGIEICDEWFVDFNEFAAWAITHGYEDHLTIDRIDVNGHYEPRNCRWVTFAQQQCNRRRRPVADHIPLSLQVSLKLKARLQFRARKLGVTMSSVAREILSAHAGAEMARLTTQQAA